MNADLFKTRLKKIVKNNGVLLAMLVLAFCGSILFEEFLTAGNITNLLRQSSMIGLMAIGMTFVILSEGIDLSVGSTFGLAGVIAGLISNELTGNVFVMIAVPVLVCTLIGVFNGLVVTKMKITPFIVTLATMLGVRGIGLALTNSGKSVGIMNKSFAVLGKGVWLGIPVPVIILAVAFGIAMFVARYTTFGRNCYAIGGNSEAAITKGINVDRVKVATYALSSALAGLAGVILAARTNIGQVMIGDGYEMTVIASVILGGTLLSGGVGKIINSLFGALIIMMIGNMINLSGYISWLWQGVVTGFLLLTILVLQSRFRNDEGLSG